MSFCNILWLSVLLLDKMRYSPCYLIGWLNRWTGHTYIYLLGLKTFKVFFAKKQSDRDSPKGSGLGTYTSPTLIK